MDVMEERCIEIGGLEDFGQLSEHHRSAIEPSHALFKLNHIGGGQGGI